jgi:hypothetical protein
LGAMAAVSIGVRKVNRAAKLADPEDAGIVALSGLAGKVADRALKLAKAAREDTRAVAELVALAGDSKKTLGNAERFIRQGARHCEDARFNRAHRLLVAAVSGSAVQPPSAETKRIFKVVKAFRALTPAQKWERLVSIEPRLAELESETRRGTFTTPVPGGTDRGDAVLSMVRREQVLRRSELGDRLRELVGPIAPATDLLIKSREAFAFALAHLADVDETASR